MTGYWEPVADEIGQDILDEVSRKSLAEVHNPRHPDLTGLQFEAITLARLVREHATRDEAERIHTGTQQIRDHYAALEIKLREGTEHVRAQLRDQCADAVRGHNAATRLVLDARRRGGKSVKLVDLVTALGLELDD